MNISLPSPLRAFIDGQVAGGRYSSASEYIRELISADEKRTAQDQLETMLLEGLASPETPWSGEDLETLRQIGRSAR